MPEWVATVSKAAEDFLYHISPSVVGVLLGGWIIDYISHELSDLVDETLLYWSIDCTATGTKADADRKQAAQLAAKIKGASHNLIAVLRSYSKKYCKDVDFQGLWSEVHEACTGGDFEGTGRLPDPHRYARVVSTTHRLRWQLYERRV
jgi:hypothetical protein